MPSPSKKRAKKGQDTVVRFSALATGLENDLPEKVASPEPSALYKSVLDRWKTKSFTNPEEVATILQGPRRGLNIAP